MAVTLAGVWWWTGRPEQVPVVSQRPPAVSPMESGPPGWRRTIGNWGVRGWWANCHARPWVIHWVRRGPRQ